MFSLKGTYYSHLVHMFYANMPSIVDDVIFRVTTYGQSFLISFHSIGHVLGMPRLDARLPLFVLEVKALTQGELVTIPTTLFGAHQAFPFYISILGFSKPEWIFAKFLTYSFYPSTHCTEI